jgi:hypothetical protein
VADEVRVKGLRELNRALKRTSKETRLGIRKEIRSVADPVKDDAEDLATAKISNIGDTWAKMRIGQTLDSIYVAPKQRGVGRRGDRSRKRPNLAARLMDDAMQPALDRHQADAQDRVDDMLGRVASRFSRG